MTGVQTCALPILFDDIGAAASEDDDLVKISDAPAEEDDQPEV